MGSLSRRDFVCASLAGLTTLATSSGVRAEGSPRLTLHARRMRRGANVYWLYVRNEGDAAARVTAEGLRAEGLAQVDGTEVLFRVRALRRYRHPRSSERWRAGMRTGPPGRRPVVALSPGERLSIQRYVMVPPPAHPRLNLERIRLRQVSVPAGVISLDGVEMTY